MKPISESLLGLELPALKALAKAHGQPEFRGKQLHDWLYRQEVTSLEAMANLPAGFRASLAASHELGRHAPVGMSESSDGTKKYLYEVRISRPNGLGEIRHVETAYIPEPDRATLCVSTQAGCKMGCLFCATAKQGWQGNLTAGQILNQFLSLPERPRLTNIVYMGMGEPLDNPDGTFGSLRLFTSPEALGLSQKRITLSTVGLPGPLQTFLSEFDIHLAISIHSPFDEERRSLMPIQHVHPIKDILELLRAYHFDDHRRLSFEYIMFAGLNDSPAHARELVRLVSNLNCRVNLIHYHSVPGNDLQGSDRPAMEAFQTILRDKGLNATIRRSRGEDIQAACGLLSTKALLAKTPAPDQDW